MSELIPESRWRTQVPESHRYSLDGRLMWLWAQALSGPHRCWCRRRLPSNGRP